MMSFRPRCVEDWLEAVPNLLSDDWDIEVEKPQATLSYMACPWGGQLIRVAVAGICVSDAPVKKSHVLVRPETRAAFGTGSLLEHFAPGNAVVLRWADWGLLRLCSILFGDMAGPTFTTSARNLKTAPVLTYQRLRRDFPSPGDAAIALFHEGDDAQEGFLMSSPTVATENKFDLMGVFRMPDEKFTSWTSIHFQLLLDSACRASHWLLNGPRTREMRQADAEAYVVLTIQSCKRGLPLYPFVPTHGAMEPTVSIAAGEHLGLDKWIRFTPGQVGSEKFRLSEYIQLFLQNLGEALPIYYIMDGRKLVPYQCVVRREDWLRVRKRFVECFLLQKTAYRRANGGSTAPSLHEDVEPRFITERSPPAGLLRTGARAAGVRVVVRRTFVEVESEEESDDDVVPSGRQSQRPKTTTILPVEISVA